MPRTLPCGCPADHGKDDVLAEFVSPDKSALKLSDDQRLGNVVQLLNQPQVFIEPPNCQEVVQGLYVGPLSAASPSLIKKHSIERVVTFEDLPDLKGVEVLRVWAEDRADEPVNLLHLLPQCLSFMCKQQAVLEEGGNVLVVSRYGLSRAPALCAAFLIAKFKLTPSQAWAKMRAVRSWIKPNRSLVLQTKWWHALGCTLEQFSSPLHSRFRMLNFAYHFKYSQLLSQCFPPLHTLSISDTSFTSASPRTSNSPSSSSSAPSTTGSVFHSSASNSSSFASSAIPVDVFCCVCCRQPVMERKHILATHFKVTEAEDAVVIEQDSVTSECQFFHVEPLQWMVESERPGGQGNADHFKDHHRCLGLDLSLIGQFAFQRELLTLGQAYSIAEYCRGPLLCPACRCPLGWFNWEGSRCSCHYLEKPAFQIAKTRVTTLSPEKIDQPTSDQPSIPIFEKETTPVATETTSVTKPIVLHLNGIRHTVLKFKSRTQPSKESLPS